ncbi:MAG: N-acetylmuramic acid 6-phosphate etherase [Burkholderiales bacterium]|nr:N-acetylmuramic acid 6-phosphate etherase [Phycisphaerae bacterium]
MIDRSQFLTEQRLPESMNLDTMSVEEILAVMNAQDRVAVDAVTAVCAEVGQAVELVVNKLSAGGRLIYVGAGTSGRLGVLDASECPPTFRTDPQQIIGIIAGGEQAMFRAQEGAEDNADDGARQMANLSVSEQDAVCGIAAGGTTPFVHGALGEAKTRRAGTVFITCVRAFDAEPAYDVVVRALTGPEILTGSTRLKAGTATKLILNQITTASMVRLGKCYENLMVDLRATNEKLRDRAARMVAVICDISRQEAADLVQRANGEVKVAIVMKLRCDGPTEARARLQAAGNSLRNALGWSPI